jgi:hypothetical protein
MIEALLTIISILLVVLTTVIYQLIIELKQLPKSIIKILMSSVEKKIELIASELKKIKNDMGLD